MKLFFIVDYKNNSGIGHLNRSILIAKKLYNLNSKIYFLCNKNFSDQDKKKFEFIKLKEKPLKKNLITIKKEISLKSPDLIIFDTYEVDQKIIDNISKVIRNIMVIHDYKFFKKNVHIYLNPTFSNRLISKNLLIGPKYALVEKKNRIIKNYKKDIKNILLFFGGSDSNKLNIKFLKIFNSKIFQKFNFNFIMGPNVKDLNIIRNSFKLKNFNKIKFDKNFHKNLYKSDLYIGTGGSSLMDVVITGTPAIFFPINKNQKNNCSFLHKQKKIIVENIQKLEKTELIRKKLINYFNDYKSIKKIAKLNLKVFDGLGPARVAKHILKHDRTNA